MSRSELKEAKSAGLPKKPKKSSTFAIYDALKANQSLHSISSSSHQPVKGLHTNAARWNEVLLPKSFVMKKKRGKKLSTFKKKILMVCLFGYVYHPYSWSLKLYPRSSPPGTPPSKHKATCGCTGRARHPSPCKRGGAEGEC